MANELDPHTIKTFNIATSSSGSTFIPVRIVEPKITSENLPLTTWASSLILANALHKFDLGRHLDPSSFPPASPLSSSKPATSASASSFSSSSSSELRIHPVIEIGAGTGLVGLTAAALLGATHATLTDLSGIVPGIAANIAVNAELLISRKCVVRAGTLDWERPEILDYPLTGKGSSLPPRLVAAAVPDDSEEQDAGSNEASEVGHVADSTPKAHGEDSSSSSSSATATSSTAPTDDGDTEPDPDPTPRSGESTPKTHLPSSSSSSSLSSSSTSPVYRARLIFASDVIYDEDHPGMLASVVRTWLDRSPAARFVICYALRVAYLDYVRDLWARLEALGLEPELEGQERGEEETNGDDEMLCEYVVFRWSEAALSRMGLSAGAGEEGEGVGEEGRVQELHEGLERLEIGEAERS